MPNNPTVATGLPTLDSMLRTCQRTLDGLEGGTITPGIANANVNTVSAIVRIVNLELQAAKLLNRAPTMLPLLMPGVETKDA